MTEPAFDVRRGPERPLELGLWGRVLEEECNALRAEVDGAGLLPYGALWAGDDMTNVYVTTSGITLGTKSRTCLG